MPIYDPPKSYASAGHAGRPLDSTDAFRGQLRDPSVITPLDQPAAQRISALKNRCERASRSTLDLDLGRTPKSPTASPDKVSSVPQTLSSPWPGWAGCPKVGVSSAALDKEFAAAMRMHACRS